MGAQAVADRRVYRHADHRERIDSQPGISGPAAVAAHCLGQVQRSRSQRALTTEGTKEKPIQPRMNTNQHELAAEGNRKNRDELRIECVPPAWPSSVSSQNHQVVFSRLLCAFSISCARPGSVDPDFPPELAGAMFPLCSRTHPIVKFSTGHSHFACDHGHG